MASTTTKLNKYNSDERRARTRTLIQLGGLLNLSGLSELCDINPGEDLQLDTTALDKSATLLGILLEAKSALSSPMDLEAYRQSGENFMKLSASNKFYERKE